MSVAQTQSRVNDFAIKIATVNGTGSASANGLIMKAIFRSGVPVVGKNYFPSNIQGMPTWYEIRVSHDGHRARGSGRFSHSTPFASLRKWVSSGRCTSARSVFCS